MLCTIKVPSLVYSVRIVYAISALTYYLCTYSEHLKRAQRRRWYTHVESCMRTTCPSRDLKFTSVRCALSLNYVTQLICTVDCFFCEPCRHPVHHVCIWSVHFKCTQWCTINVQCTVQVHYQVHSAHTLYTVIVHTGAGAARMEYPTFAPSDPVRIESLQQCAQMHSTLECLGTIKAPSPLHLHV